MADSHTTNTADEAGRPGAWPQDTLPPAVGALARGCRRNLSKSAQAQSSMATRSSSLHSKMALRSVRADTFATMKRQNSFLAVQNRIRTADVIFICTVTLACREVCDSVALRCDPCLRPEPHASCVRCLRMAG